MLNRIVKIASLAIGVVALYSLLPVALLYLAQSPLPYGNDNAVERLKGNQGVRFSFILFGDNHAGFIFSDSATLKMIGRINGEDRSGKVPVDFVLALGDITNGGSVRDYRIFNKIRSRIKWPVVCAIGNHDDEDRFRRNAGQHEFSFSNRNSYFIIVNNVRADLPDSQFEWLEQELKKSLSYSHRFVIAHKAPYSPYRQPWYSPGGNPWSYRFMKLCERYKVDMVFSGHDHAFQERTFGGVRYIVSGGAGRVPKIPGPEGGFLHYLVVRVNGEYVDFEIRKIFPPLWEYFTFYLWKDLFYFLKDVVA